MDKIKIAKELIKLAKELTAGIKITKTFHRDRDIYDEVDVIAEIPVSDGAAMVASQIEKATKMVEKERQNIIRDFGAKPDPYRPARIDVYGTTIRVVASFSTTMLVRDINDVKSQGFKIL